MTIVTPVLNHGEQAEQADATESPKPCRRIILMSGDSQVGHRAYHMEGTLFASVSGDLVGEILWSNLTDPGFPVGLSGSELVRGTATESELISAGYEIEKPYLKERYRITLGGAAPGETGSFWGISEAYGVWDNRMAGTYQIVLEYD